MAAAQAAAGPAGSRGGRAGSFSQGTHEVNGTAVKKEDGAKPSGPPKTEGKGADGKA